MSIFGQELWYPAQPSGCPDKFEIPFFTQSKQIWDQRRKLVLRLTYLSLLKLGKKCVADLGPNLALTDKNNLQLWTAKAKCHCFTGTEQLHCLKKYSKSEQSQPNLCPVIHALLCRKSAKYWVLVSLERPCTFQRSEIQTTSWSFKIILEAARPLTWPHEKWKADIAKHQFHVELIMKLVWKPLNVTWRPLFLLTFPN